MAIVDTPNQNLFGTNYNPEDEEEKRARLAARGAIMGAGFPALDSNIVAQVPGIENIRNPGAFDPANMEPVEQVGPPTTVGESISQTYNESVLADLVNKGFGQEAFQSQAPDGTPTYSIYNKRFGTLGSQVPYSEAGPEAKAQAMNFMLETGGQERPLPETPTSPVRTPEQVQSILDEQRAAQAASALGATQFTSPDSLALPSETVGQVPSVNAFSAENAGQVNAMMEAQSLEATQGGATAPPPAQTLSQFMRYEDAPEQRTEQFVDAQGRMRFRPTQEALQLQGQGEVAQPPAAALSSFEQDSLSRQQRIGGTGSYEGDSEARDARVRASNRQPGESQADRDTRVAQSRTQGSRAEGELSQSDLRDLAQGSSRDATDGEKARALEIQQRAGLGAFKPDMTPSETKALQVESADKDSFNTSISNSTSPQGVVDYNQALNEYVKGGGSSKGYLEFLRKGQELEQKAIDAGKKPEITVVEIGGFRALLQDGRYMTGTTVGGDKLSTSAIRTLQGRIELLGDAEENYLSGDPERIKRAERTITALDIKNSFGGQLSAKDYFEPNSDGKPFDPDALKGKDKEAYDFAIKNPDAPQSNSILRLLGAN